LVLANLITFFLSQSKAQEKLEDNLRAKADSKEIAEVLINVSQEIYRNFEFLSLLKRSSSALEDIKQDTPINPESVQLRQSLADFGEGIKNISNNIIKLNQSRVMLEKKYNEVENVKNQFVGKKEVKEWINSVKNELLEKVIIYSIKIDE